MAPVLWFIGLIALSCSPSPEPKAHERDSADTHDKDSLVDSDQDPSPTAPEIHGSASVIANPFNRFGAVVLVRLDQDATVRVEYGEEYAQGHSTPPVQVKKGETARILVMGLRAARSHELVAIAKIPGGTWRSTPLHFVTDPLPREWPLCSVEIPAQASADPDEVICLDGKIGESENVHYCMDFAGEPVASFQTADNDGLLSMLPLSDGTWASTSSNNSKLLLLDRSGRVSKEFRPSFFKGRTRFQHDFIDAHEIIELSEGPWQGAVAFLTYTTERLDDGSARRGNGLIVFDPRSEEILYDYSFHGEMGDNRPMDELVSYDRLASSDYEGDWTHGNSLLYGVEDSGRPVFWVHLKAQDWVVKLDPELDELLWRLGYQGEFQLVDDIDAAKPIPLPNHDWFYHAHDMSWLERSASRSRMLLFDNGFHRRDESGGWEGEPYHSRVAEFRVDEDSLLVDLNFEHGPENGADPDFFFTEYYGGAELLPDGERLVFISPPIVREISYPEGETLWQLRCEREEMLYRAGFFPDLYHTAPRRP